MTGMGPLEIAFIVVFFAVFLSIWTYVWGRLVAVRSARLFLTAVALRVTATDAASVQPGRVTVSGTAREDVETVRTPVSRTECLAYEVHVMRSDSDGDHLAVETVEDGAPFDVHDDLASVSVDPAEAALNLPEEDAVTGDPNAEHPERVRDLLDSASPCFGSEHSGEFKIREDRLHDGDDVLVHGIASDDARVTIADAPEASGVVDRVLPDSFFVATSDEAPTSLAAPLLGIAIGTALTALPLVATYNEFLAG
ncbi:hypothetical protein [Halorubellus sp. PRR65]|uniref:hypothetical protein n=1 Tax=Halorubellus sp. PRR65 TaxID=3098148 RepID=UPI002B258E83|nr:hypothetical protein [Halorubellus sp. PRR65]